MGFAAPLMMIAGTGLGALSTYRQGQAAANQAKAQASLSEHNARVADTNAEAILQKSIFDQLRAVRAGDRILGRLRAKQGVSGAVMSEGAPFDVVAEQAAENALDVALIGYTGMTEAERQKNAASMYHTEAQNYYTTADNLKTAGKLGAGTHLLQGFGTMSSMGAWPKPLSFLNIA